MGCERRHPVQQRSVAGPVSRVERRRHAGAARRSAARGHQGRRGLVAVFPPGRPPLSLLGQVTVRDSGAVYVTSLEPGAGPRRLVASDSNAVYASPGFLLFAREGALLRQPFDAERLEIEGGRSATPVVERIASNDSGVGGFSASQTGVLSYRPRAVDSTQFAWFDRNGRMLRTVGPPGSYRTLALSPDEKRLAYGDVARGDVWILEMQRQTQSRFTYATGSIETAPVWSPDGTKDPVQVDAGRGKRLREECLRHRRGTVDPQGADQRPVAGLEGRKVAALLRPTPEDGRARTFSCCR